VPRPSDAQVKIEKAAKLVMEAVPALDRHPGAFIKEVLLPAWGLSVAQAARSIGVDRAGFHNTLAGKYDVSRDLAYRLGALMTDDVADLLIAYQHAFDLAKERDRRDAFKAQIVRVSAPVRD